MEQLANLYVIKRDLRLCEDIAANWDFPAYRNISYAIASIEEDINAIAKKHDQEACTKLYRYILQNHKCSPEEALAKYNTVDLEPRQSQSATGQFHIALERLDAPKRVIARGLEQIEAVHLALELEAKVFDLFPDVPSVVAEPEGYKEQK
jgi:hypothetical protein